MGPPEWGHPLGTLIMGTPIGHPQSGDPIFGTPGVGTPIGSPQNGTPKGTLLGEGWGTPMDVGLGWGVVGLGWGVVGL